MMKSNSPPDAGLAGLVEVEGEGVTSIDSQLELSFHRISGARLKVYSNKYGVGRRDRLASWNTSIKSA